MIDPRSGGPKFEYLWQDGAKYKKPTPLPASQYISFLMDWIESQVLVGSGAAYTSWVSNVSQAHYFLLSYPRIRHIVSQSRHPRVSSCIAPASNPLSSAASPSRWPSRHTFFKRSTLISDQRRIDLSGDDRRSVSAHLSARDQHF